MAFVFYSTGLLSKIFFTQS